jgi:hypothetical protein
MRLVTMAMFAALAATTPAVAAETDPATNTTAATTVPDPAVDGRVAAKDQARQNLYQHKLDAANAQTQADNAVAQADNAAAQADQAAAKRDESLDKAAEDRADIHAANQ